MMKRYIVMGALMTVCGPLFGQALKFKAPYEKSEHLRDASSSMVTYRNAKTAFGAVADSSVAYVGLNGMWKVKFYDNAKNVAKNDLQRDNKLESGWGSVTLPMSMQIAGDGKGAIFADKAYDFLKTAPTNAEALKMPQSGLVALYARDFTIPFDFLDKQIFFNIEGSRGKTTLIVNGTEVGFATNSKNKAQFDVTSFVERGLNRAVLKVEQFCGASYIENQQMWRLSGVNRDIFILAQPKIRMRDYLVRTSLDPTYENGLLETAVLLKTEQLNPHKVTVFYDLFGPDGKLVAQNSREVEVGMRVEDTVRFTTSIFGVQKWNAETPNLYTILYKVKREGRFTEYGTVKVGFRQVETVNQKLLVNGIAPTIKGVNFEEFDAQTGNVLKPNEVLAQLRRLRLMGVNAIRTGGYPLPTFFYDMTDSIGFYVVSVANIDASGFENSTTKGRSVANNPAWKDIFTDRAIDAYEQVENKPSVIAIALGEDAGNGYCMYQAYLAIKKRDQNRLVVYDGAGAEWNTDVVCPLYPKIGELKKIKALQPIVPSRVVFDAQYWRVDGVQGAFIDRVVSPDLSANVMGGTSKLTNDYRPEKLASGKVDLSNAMANETAVMELFSPIKMRAKDAAKGIYEIENNLQYTNLNKFKITCFPMSGGRASRAIDIKVDCPVGNVAEIVIPGASVISPMREIVLEVGNIYKVVFTR